MSRERPLPQVWSGRKTLSDVEVPPELRDHPRIGEYLRYANPMRFPKPFPAWLAETEMREAGKSLLGANLQRAMDEQKFCADPRKIRVHK